MSDWKDEDTVTTTYRTIAKASAEAFEMGALTERERIIALIESKDEWHYAFSDVSDVIALIKGEQE